MIRLQDHSPSVYTEGSRDFQLFCRLYDCINNGVLFDIASIQNLLDPFKANDRILDLLATRVGFFPKHHYDSKVLRYIIKAFATLVKNKGNKKGIEGAICAILKVEGNFGTPEILIDNINHSISIFTSIKLYNKKALREVLEYIIPAGYTFGLYEYDEGKVSDIIGTKDSVSFIQGPSINMSQVRGSDRILNMSGQTLNSFNFDSSAQDLYIANFNLTTVIGSSNYSTIKDSSGDIIYGSDRLGTTRDSIDESSNLIDSN